MNVKLDVPETLNLQANAEILPQKASDIVLDKIKFPGLAMPKIDGVRSLNQNGRLVGRSLKQHANKFTTVTYSIPEFNGFDGEMTADEITHPHLVNLTSSALARHDGKPNISWWLFDLVTDETKHLSYERRLQLLSARVSSIKANPNLAYFHDRINVIKTVKINNMEEFLAQEAEWLDAGFEGLIYREIESTHKSGYTNQKNGGYWRLKRFKVEEALVLSFEEGLTNNNEATVNKLGRSSRSTHKENMVPNGQVGNLQCVALKNGNLITVGPGRMKHNERIHFFGNPHELIGQVIKYKHFPKGVKNKPRFPTYECIRPESDMDPKLIKAAETLRKKHFTGNDIN